MRLTSMLVLSTGLLFTAGVYADEVPVVDAYQQQDSAVATTSPAPATTLPPATSDTTAATPDITASTTTTPDSSATASVNASLPLDQRVTILERQANAMMQMQTHLNQLQQQVQDLRGKLDVQTHQLQLLQSQVRNQYQDLDQRVNQNGSKSIDTGGKAVAAPTSDDTNVADAGNAMNTDAIAVDSTKTTAKKKSHSAKQTTDNNSNDNQAATSQQSIDTLSDNDNSIANNSPDTLAYQAAFAQLKKKNYTKATQSFQNFVKQYPDSQSVVNARYWLGQLYLLQGQPDKSIDQFKLILKKYPSDSKVADATLQLGLAYYAKGDLQQAKVQLNRVQQKYPDSSAAKLAKTRLQEIAGSASADNTRVSDNTSDNNVDNN